MNCEKCHDTGSLEKTLDSNNLDCAWCEVATTRAELEAWALKEKLDCNVVALWLIYNKARQDTALTNVEGLPPGLDYEGDDGTIAAYRNGALVWHANVYANDDSVNDAEVARTVASVLNTRAPEEK